MRPKATLLALVHYGFRPILHNRLRLRVAFHQTFIVGHDVFRNDLGEPTRSLGSISAQTLSKQLRELEEDGVVDLKDFGEIPPKVEYSLTPLGKTLESVLLSMEAWGLAVEKRGRRTR